MERKNTFTYIYKIFLVRDERSGIYIYKNVSKSKQNYSIKTEEINRKLRRI